MYVYVISNPMFPGWYKVGKAKNIHKRFINYHTYAPEEYVLECTFKFMCDKPVHNRLTAMGIESHREWFKTDLDTIKSAITLVAAEHSLGERYE